MLAHSNEGKANNTKIPSYEGKEGTCSASMASFKGISKKIPFDIDCHRCEEKVINHDPDELLHHCQQGL